MKRRQLIALGSAVFVFVAVLASAPARGVIVNSLVGIAEMVQRVHEDRCWSFIYPRYFLWNRFDPTCPQCF